MTMTYAAGAIADAHGNPMTGDAASVEVYDRALDRLVRFHPEVVDLATALATVDEPVPMANVLFAYLHLMSTDVDDVATATACWRALADADLNEREHLHARAVGAWVNGDWIGASRALDEVLYRWPTDIAGPDVRAPARLLPRRRPEPPGSGCAFAA